ncbi:hypothetical protein M101_2717, partial [Bacteroides fragilis str. 1007-1-F 
MAFIAKGNCFLKSNLPTQSKFKSPFSFVLFIIV